jgi:hypothetical protein
MLPGRRVIVVLAVLLAHGIQPSALSGQRISGRLVDASSEQPVGSAHVVLLALDGDTLRQTFADERGAFALAAPRPGTYRIEVSQLGYRTLRTDTLTLGPNQLIEVSLRMGAAAIPLDPLTVVARSRDALHDLTYDGLYARRAFSPAVGSNRVFVKGDREFRSAIKASDLLWYVRPRRTDWNEATHTNDPCVPYVFWHGFLVGRGVRAEIYLDRSAADLEGIEIYRSWNSLPLDLRMQLSGSLKSVRECGVVALWPRRPDYPRR